MAIFSTDSGSLNSLKVTGSAVVSASSGIVLQLKSSGSTIFSVSGSVGEILNISDIGTDNSLFSVSSGSVTIFNIDNTKKVSVSGSLVVTGSATISGSLNANNTLYVSGSNVGIGTSTPSVKLDVVGNANITGSTSISGSLTLDIPGKANNYVLKSDANGGATWANPSTLAANLIASGSVSASVNIGTSSFSVSSGSQELMQVRNDGTTRFSGSISIGDPALNGLGLKIINTYGNGNLTFGNDGLGNLSLTPTNSTITFKGRYKIDSAGTGTSVVTCSILELTSTTAGFLPPRMSGSQAEAISTPLDGLMVFANNGNGTTITSTGWWGYSGSAWHKFNIT